MNHHKTDRKQAASPRDAMSARIFVLPALALAAVVAAGCAGVAADTRATDAIAIERVDSAHAEVGSVQVRKSPEVIQVHGRLQKRFAGRSPIQGHLHVEALGANGALLAEAITPYRRLNPKMGFSELSQPLAVSPGQVRVVRITHHLEHAGG
jgi:hypothetical protein